MNYYKSSFISIFLLLLIIICIILIYNYRFSNVKNSVMNMNKKNIVTEGFKEGLKEGFKEGLNPSLNQVPNFFAEFGSDTSKTVFNLDGWGLYSNMTTYGNEGLASLITSEPPVTQGTSGPRIAGFFGNSEVFITISCPRGLALNGIRWYGSAEYGPDRNAKDVEVFGVNRGLEGISYNSDGRSISFPTHMLPGWWYPSANGFIRLTNFTVPQTCSLGNPSWFSFSPAAYSMYLIRIVNNYGDSSVKVNCLGLSFNPPDNISPPESTAAIRARKQAVIDAERQRQEAAAAETKRVAALADAKSAASAAIVAADAAVSVANGGGSSQPEMDAKKAANDSKTAATAASTAANSASTLQSAIDAKAAADKAKADADNAKSAANAAIAAAAASSLAQKKAEAKKNVDDALAIATQQIAALNASTSSMVATTETFIGNYGARYPTRFESSSLFDKIVRFFAPLREGVVGDSATTASDDLFASVKSKAAAAQAIISKTSPPATIAELTEALKLSLEALAEAQSIKTNLIACKASPRPTIKYNANTGVVPAAPADGSLYWSTESGKDYLILSKKDASSPAVSVESTLVYCARKDKFIILYNSDIIASRKFIQYKIKSVTPITTANTYVKYEVEIVSNTSGFTKTNITNAQAVYISTSDALTQMSTSDGATVVNPCAGPNPSANCKPVCIPTDKTTGAIVYKPDTTIPATIFTGKPLSYNNYYEYTPVRGIAGDGSAVYYPMDTSKTFVGNGTKCLQGCSEYDDGKTREDYCKPSNGDRPLGVDLPKTEGTCMTGCIAVTDPTDRRNSSRCSYNKISGYTCKPICDFGSAPNNCKINADCNYCDGDIYVKRFPIGWKPTITKTLEQTYTLDQCKEKCKKPTKDTCLNFLQLEQGGGYLENKCRKVGKTKVICKPISQVTPNGLVAGYDGCSVCKTNTGLYGYFEYEKEWNKELKQWDFKNIKEITSPDKSWFEYGSGAGGGGGSSRGYGASSGSSSGGGYSSYSNDKGSGDSGDSKKTDDLKSGDSSKSVSISAASQDAKRQELSAKAAELKLKLDKLTTEYNDLVDTVKWNKLQMEKAEKECNDMKTKLKRAISDYIASEVKSTKSGSTPKEKMDTEAANTLMYTIKHKSKEICNNYASLKYKYTKSVYVLNELKNKKDDLKKQYDTAAADVGSGSGFGSLLTPIINIFFGDDANQDCSGQLGCGKGIDYTYPSPFNSAKSGLFTPQPYYDGIHF
jgi:hypothetical protein